MTRMLCVKCGWMINNNIQLSFCPSCKAALKLVKGTEEYVEQRTKELLVNLPKK